MKIDRNSNIRITLLISLFLVSLGNTKDTLATAPVDSIALLREALANHKEYLGNRVTIGKGFNTYYAIQDQNLGMGLRPQKEIELASRIGSKTESSFRTARALNWISIPTFLIGYGMFLYYFASERTAISYYEGDRKYAGTGAPEDHGGYMAVGAVVGVAGIIGWVTAFQIHKSALYDLDRDMRKYYGVE